MKIDREMVKMFHAELSQVLSALGKKHGLEFKPPSSRFSSTEIVSRVTFTLKGNEGARVNKISVRLGYAFKYGDFVLSTSGKSYKIVDASTRGSVVGENSGKRWRIHHVLPPNSMTAVRDIFGPHSVNLTSEEGILNRMRDMMGTYSIESVSADGERSHSAIRQMQSTGRKEWSRLVKLLGRTPTHAEMYPGVEAFKSDKTPCTPEGLGL